jgi:hypothetical protein
MCSVAFPAFALGQDPTKRLIVASYSADLAIKHANDFRTVVNSAEYHAIFPAARSALQGSGGVSRRLQNSKNKIRNCDRYHFFMHENVLQGQLSDTVSVRTLP